MTDIELKKKQYIAWLRDNAVEYVPIPQCIESLDFVDALNYILKALGDEANIFMLHTDILNQFMDMQISRIEAVTEKDTLVKSKIDHNTKVINSLDDIITCGNNAKYASSRIKENNQRLMRISKTIKTINNCIASQLPPEVWNQ